MEIISEYMVSKKQQRKDHLPEFRIMPFDMKVTHAKKKIKEFFEWMIETKKKEVLVGFSGGKDSTVLLDLVYKVWNEQNFKKDIDVFIGYAYEITFPETLKFIKETEEKYNFEMPLITFPPKMPWVEALNHGGYPAKSKRFSIMVNRLLRSRTKTTLSQCAFGIEDSTYYKVKKTDLHYLDLSLRDYSISEKCCDYIKGGLKKDKRPAFVGTMADESQLRKRKWIDNGCNVFDEKKPMSRPLSIWNEENVWEYIETILDGKTNPLYKKYGFSRLGCASCTFGAHLEKKHKRVNRFEKLMEINPNLYKSQVWDTGIYKVLMDMDIEIETDPKYMEALKERRKVLADWYSNLQYNLIKIMHQIQDNENWTYTKTDIKKAYKHYDLDVNNIPFDKFKFKKTK